MLNKFLKVHKLAPFLRQAPPLPPPPPLPADQLEASLALKIVHAGGHVECYYMAIPAKRIMEKYPSFLVTKPEVFKRPWDSVVWPDEILLPGEKFFIVPRRTVKKLRKKIREPSAAADVSANSFVSRGSRKDASVDMISRQKDQLSRKIFVQRHEVSDSSEGSDTFSATRKKNTTKKHVRFAGIDAKHKAAVEKKGGDKAEEHSRKGRSPAESNGGKRRAGHSVSWQPSLTIISESQGNDE